MVNISYFGDSNRIVRMAERSKALRSGRSLPWRRGFESHFWQQLFHVHTHYWQTRNSHMLEFSQQDTWVCTHCLNISVTVHISLLICITDNMDQVCMVCQHFSNLCQNYQDDSLQSWNKMEGFCYDYLKGRGFVCDPSIHTNTSKQVFLHYSTY